MKLQTNVQLKKQPENPINYQSKIVLLGSCFSENIGAKFDFYNLSSINQKRQI